MIEEVHYIAVVQFFLGTVIAALNVLLLISILANRKLRTAPYVLTGNLWFVNLLLGVIITVVNVADRSEPIALAKAEGTISVVNCLVTLATFLSIGTSHLVHVRNPSERIGLRTVAKLLIAIWCGVFGLILIKTIVYALSNMSGTVVCYECLLGFEAALLLCFGVAALVLYTYAIYAICVRRKSTVQDRSSPPPVLNVQEEYENLITLGILIGTFMLPFLMVIVLLVIYVVDDEKYLGIVSTEAILTVFYLHCVINPLVFLARDVEVRRTAKRLICCERPPDRFENGEVIQDFNPPRGAQIQREENQEREMEEIDRNNGFVQREETAVLPGQYGSINRNEGLA